MWKMFGLFSRIVKAARQIQGHVLAPVERLLERLIENDYVAGRDEVKSWATYADLEAKVMAVLSRNGVPAEIMPAVMDELLPIALEWLDGMIPEEQIEPIVEALRRL